MLKAVLLFALIMFVCSGCGSFGVYCSDRALDFADMFRLEVGAGLGYYLFVGNVALTETVQVSPLVINSNGKIYFLKAGFIGRKAGVWAENEMGTLLVMSRFGSMPGSFGGSKTKPMFERLPLCGNIEPCSKRGERGTSHFLFEEEAWRRYEIGIELCFFLGCKAGIDLAEVLDFIFGWTTLDIMKDDDLHSMGGAFNPSPGGN